MLVLVTRDEHGTDSSATAGKARRDAARAAATFIAIRFTLVLLVIA
jgi:hypothetical protein